MKQKHVNETAQVIRSIVREELRKATPKPKAEAPPKTSGRKAVDLLALLLTAGATLTPLVVAILLLNK